MTKTDIFSGFLGAGKTSLIRKLIAEAYKGEKLVLIENEFGDIAIDGAFLKDAGIEITEMNSGCICCTLVGDFRKALEQVVKEFTPDRIIIEPSGVGKLSDVAKAVEAVDGIEIGTKVTVVDASKCKIYMRNFGEFFNDQVENADLIVLSRTGMIDEAKTFAAAELLRTLNAECGLITTPWDAVSGEQIKAAMEENGLKRAMEELAHEHHHHHDDDEEEECECCHHHHHDDDEDEEHEHHHHHHHHHEGELDADDVFQSWGVETAHKFEKAELEEILRKLADEDSKDYGMILRAKGMVPDAAGQWHEFDLTPGEYEIRESSADYTGRLCVIGSDLKEDRVKELFGV